MYRGDDPGGPDYQITGGETGEQTTLYYYDANADGTWDAGEGIYANTSTTSSDICADVEGAWRHAGSPSMGAYEYHLSTTGSSGGDGRIDERTIDGRVCEYDHDGRGRLDEFTDTNDATNSATYEYDFLGNRIKMSIGAGTSKAVTYYFMYEGEDVVAEYVDEGSDGDIDRKRIYWILPEIDQRIGFVDLKGSSVKYYFYNTDQVGSVLQVVDENQNVVNQYDYDAHGNLSEENSWEKVENRYRFQGREWDAHAGHYYFRNRTYLPEWGCFTGPDPLVYLDGKGVFHYGFPGANTLVDKDPKGDGPGKKKKRRSSAREKCPNTACVKGIDTTTAQPCTMCDGEGVKKVAHNPGNGYLAPFNYIAKDRPGEQAKVFKKATKGKSWPTVRSWFWKLFGRDGKPPRRVVVVKKHKTGTIETKAETKEIHHKKGRAEGGTHDLDNLEEAWPKEHEARDQHRHTGYDIMDE